MTTLKVIGYALLAILGILLSPLLVILISVFIVAVLLFAFVRYIVTIPKQKKTKAQLQTLINELVEKDKKYAYLWYDRNSELSNYLEKDFIPKYKKYLIIKYGYDLNGNRTDEKIQEIASLLPEITENGDPERHVDDDIPAILYTFGSSTELPRSWFAIIEEESETDVDIDETIKLFKEKMEFTLPSSK